MLIREKILFFKTLIEKGGKNENGTVTYPEYVKYHVTLLTSSERHKFRLKSQVCPEQVEPAFNSMNFSVVYKGELF